MLQKTYLKKLKYETEGKDSFIDLKKLTSNSLYGQSIREDIHEEFIARSENWLMKKNDERDAAYGNRNLAICEKINKYESDPGFDKIKEIENI